MAQGTGGTGGTGGERIEGNAPAETAEALGDEQMSHEAEQKLLDRHMKAFRRDAEAEEENRKESEADERFAIGGEYQWEDVGQYRKGERLELSMNMIPQFCNQVENDHRQNRQQIKVRPGDNHAHDATVKMINGLIRNIQHESRADWAFDWSFRQAVRGGWGYFLIEPVYVDDETNNQELRISWVPSRFDVYLDASARLPWGGDARHAFMPTWLSVDEMEAMGGRYAELARAGAGGGDWPRSGWGDRSEWERTENGEKQVRVCQAWWLEPGTVTIKGITRPKVRPTLKWGVFTARGVVEGPRTLPGYRIPIVRVVGNMDVLREGLKLYSMVQNLKAPQEAHNWGVSDMFERMSLMPKASVIAPEGSLGKHEGAWADAANGIPQDVLYYTAKLVNDTTLAPAPRFSEFPQVPTGNVALVQQSEGWLRGAAGIYGANLGQPGNETSGRMVLERRKEGDTATFHYHDAMTYAMLFAGEILVDWIPHYYDWQEVARTLGEDGKVGFAKLAAPGTLKDASGKQVSVLKRPSEDDPGKSDTLYDPSVGRYDVFVDTGPSYATKREETVATMGELIPNLGPMQLLALDLFFKSSDMPDADLLAERFHEAAKREFPFITRLEQEEGEGPTDKERADQAEAMLQQIMPQAQAMAEQLQQAMQALQDQSAERELKLTLGLLEHDWQQQETAGNVKKEVVRVLGEVYKGRDDAAARLVMAMLPKQGAGTGGGDGAGAGGMRPPTDAAEQNGEG